MAPGPKHRVKKRSKRKNLKKDTRPPEKRPGGSEYVPPVQLSAVDGDVDTNIVIDRMPDKEEPLAEPSDMTKQRQRKMKQQTQTPEPTLKEKRAQHFRKLAAEQRAQATERPRADAHADAI